MPATVAGMTCKFSKTVLPGLPAMESVFCSLVHRICCCGLVAIRGDAGLEVISAAQLQQSPAVLDAPAGAAAAASPQSRPLDEGPARKPRTLCVRLPMPMRASACRPVAGAMLTHGGSMPLRCPSLPVRGCGARWYSSPCCRQL